MIHKEMVNKYDKECQGIERETKLASNEYKSRDDDKSRRRHW
jgi:hypothetical protein